MHRLLAIALVIALPGLASADDSVAARTALDHLNAGAASGAVAFPDVLTFEAREPVRWAAGSHVRVDQLLLGVPVHGHGIVVSLDLDGAVRRVSGEPLSVVLLDRTGQVPSESAEALSQAFVRAWFGGDGILWEPRSELVVHVRDDRAELAWRVDVSTARPPGNYRVLVDAQDGHVLGAQSTLVEARANVYPSNPVVSELEEVELLRLDEGDDVEGMQGHYSYVNSCTDFVETFLGGSCLAKTRHALADEAGDFLFEPDPSASVDPLAEIQMYYHLDIVSRWFEEEHGFVHPGPIEGIVNFDYNNAFYGDFDDDADLEVAFGQGMGADAAYDADVIYHEFGHSVYGRIGGQTGFVGADEYGMEWAPGSLNEGTADVFALVLTGDPAMGEYMGDAWGLGGAVRDLEEDRHCPTDLYGETHADGEILGSFAWNLIDDAALGAEFVGDYIFGAVGAFPDDVNWEQAGQALANIADDMLDASLIDADQRERLSEHLQASGLVACGRVIPLDDGAEPVQQIAATSLFPEVQVPLGVQFSLEAPADAIRLRFRVTDWSVFQPEVGWALYVRRGSHVLHEVVPLDTLLGPVDVSVPTEYDFAVEGEGDDYELELTFDSDPPLEPGATYYFSIASRQTAPLTDLIARGRIGVDGRVWLEEVAEGDEGDDDDDDDDGAGCQDCGSTFSASSPDARPVALLLLLLIAVGARRRR